jgi:hypothetical protein
MGRLQFWFGRTAEEKKILPVQNIEIMRLSSRASSVTVLRTLLPFHQVTFKVKIRFAGTHLHSCLGTVCSVVTLTLMVKTQHVCVTLVFSPAVTKSF